MERTLFVRPEIKMKWKACLSRILLAFLYGTCRWDVRGQEQIQRLSSSGKVVIIAIWHGKVLPVFMNLASKHYYALAGMHKDAELIAQIGAKVGWRLLRGSSSDRGKEVFKEMIAVLSTPGEVVAMTPDGPKGPAKIPKAGVIRAAQKSGAVVIPAIGQAKRRWGFTNWDTFYVAKPFSKIVLRYGSPLVFKKTDNFQECTVRLKNALDSLEAEVDHILSGQIE